MVQVAKLRWQVESSLINKDVMDGLVAKYGELQTDLLLSDTAEAITIRLNGVRRMIDSGALEAARFEARRISALAKEIGMERLSKVVAMVDECAANGDQISLMAILARLERLEEISLLLILGLDSDTP